MTVERNLNLFEENRTEEGKSKSKKLASEVLGKATVKTETSDVAKDAASGSSAVKTENAKKETSEDNEVPEEVAPVKTEDKKEGNDSRFNMDKFKKLEEMAKTEDGNEVEKMETEEIEDFNEYSSDEDEEEGEDEDVAAEISENEDGGFDIEFVMPKFISEKPKSKNEGKKKSEEGKMKPEEEINDFFINEGEQYNQSDEEKDDEDSSSEDEEGGKDFNVTFIISD